MEQVSKTLFWAPQRCFSFNGAQEGTSCSSCSPFLADVLPNTILTGVLQGLYLTPSCVPSQAVPRASGMSSQTPTQHPGTQW